MRIVCHISLGTDPRAIYTVALSFWRTTTRIYAHTASIYSDITFYMDDGKGCTFRRWREYSGQRCKPSACCCRRLRYTAEDKDYDTGRETAHCRLREKAGVNEGEDFIIWT